MNPEGFCDLVAYLHGGVEGGHGILENHADFPAAVDLKLLFVHFQDILPVVEDFRTLGNGYQRGLVEPEQCF